MGVPAPALPPIISASFSDEMIARSFHVRPTDRRNWACRRAPLEGGSIARTLAGSRLIDLWKPLYAPRPVAICTLLHTADRTRLLLRSQSYGLIQPEFEDGFSRNSHVLAPCEHL